MRNYLLISGAWLAAAAITAFVYARLAAYAAGSDAHHFDPRPLPVGRRRPRSPTLAVPGWIFAPLAMGCVAAVLMTDFLLAPPGVPPVATDAPAQSVRMAAVPAQEARRAKRKPRRAAARQVSAGVAVPAAAAAVPVAAAPRFARASPTAPRSRPLPRARRRPSAPAPEAVVAAVPARSPSPAPAQPESAPSPAPDPGEPHAQARGAEKKRTVHPLSKSVPGRVHRPKAPVGRPRCACR